jgi:hypothetical protein
MRVRSTICIAAHTGKVCARAMVEKILTLLHTKELVKTKKATANI